MNIKVLTNESSSITIPANGRFRVFGSSGGNVITIEYGAKVECINFPGKNEINIAENKSAFTVYRSGATVYLVNSTLGTLIKIPATKTSQTINFLGDVSSDLDDVSYDFVIINNKVMLSGKEITLKATQL